MIKLNFNVNVMHANEHTKYVNCSFATLMLKNRII